MIGDIFVLATGISHSPSILFLYPFNTIALCFIANKYFLFKKMLQSSSHNFPSDINDALFKSLITCACFAFSESAGESGNVPCFVAVMALLSGSRTVGPLTVVVFDRTFSSSVRQ